jgi:hypothetical protein
MLTLVKYCFLIATLIYCKNIQAQSQPDAPLLEFVCELKVKIANPFIVGATPHGQRRIIPIVGGTVEGPQLKGKILDSGADWQIVREDGVAELEAHYQFKTHDDVIIYIKNMGLRVASPEVAARIGKGEKVLPSEYYFRAVPKFEAPKGKYEWLNNAIFICTGERNPDFVVIKVWKVL